MVVNWVAHSSQILPDHCEPCSLDLASRLVAGIPSASTVWTQPGCAGIFPGCNSGSRKDGKRIHKMAEQTLVLKKATTFWLTVLKLLPQLSRLFIVATGATALTSLAGLAGATASPATTYFFGQLAGWATGSWILSIIAALFTHYFAVLDPSEVFNLDGPERWRRNLARWPRLAKLVAPFGHITIGGMVLSILATFLAPTILVGWMVFSFRGDYARAMYCDAEIRTYLTASSADYIIDERCTQEFSKRVKPRTSQQ